MSDGRRRLMSKSAMGNCLRVLLVRSRDELASARVLMINSQRAKKGGWWPVSGCSYAPLT
jgi:hypothetical protein